MSASISFLCKFIVNFIVNLKSPMAIHNLHKLQGEWAQAFGAKVYGIVWVTNLFWLVGGTQVKFNKCAKQSG